MSGYPVIFDRLLLRQRRRAHGQENFLLDRVALEMAERLSLVQRQFASAVDLGTPGQALRKAMCEHALAGTVIKVDGLGSAADRLSVVADEEALPLAAESVDLVVSALALHAINDLPGTLVQIRRALKPDGLFIAALLGGDTLTELRSAFAAAETEIEGGVSPRVAPFADLRALGALLQRAGFALPVTDTDALTVRYDHVFALMHDLRQMGATNVLVERSRKPLRRKTLQRMTEIYAERFSDSDGRLRATFEIVWLSGWAPHESQQKPLRPGSARQRLADALNVKEVPAGEKAGR